MTLDCFTFFNELDLLEIRLSILDPYVDYFIITESHQTFSGKWKPLNYQLNKERFNKWSHKIIYNEVGDFETSNPFDRAFYQKEDAMRFLHDPEAMVYFGDIDEIWTPYEGEEVVRLHQRNYCYYLNTRSTEEWYGTIAGKAKYMTSFNGLRATAPKTDACYGWHFTNMGGVNQIIQKMNAYDHALEVQEAKPFVVERLRDMTDYLGRGYTMSKDESEWPQFLKDNKHTYGGLCC